MVFSSVLVPVDDMEAAVRFLSDVLGMEPRFQDGARYAAFPSGAVGLAFLGGEERIVSEPSLGVQVDDLNDVLSHWCIKGAEIVRKSEIGPHELRAVVRIPGGLLLTLSQKLS